MKQQAARDQLQRRKNLVKYIPNAAKAVFTVLEAMTESNATGPKRKRLQDETDVLLPVKQMRTSEDTLIARLTEHVEKIDSDMVRSNVVEIFHSNWVQLKPRVDHQQLGWSIKR